MMKEEMKCWFLCPHCWALGPYKYNNILNKIYAAVCVCFVQMCMSICKKIFPAFDESNMGSNTMSYWRILTRSLLCENAFFVAVYSSSDLNWLFCWTNQQYVKSADKQNIDSERIGCCFEKILDTSSKKSQFLSQFNTKIKIIFSIFSFSFYSSFSSWFVSVSNVFFS